MFRPGILAAASARTLGASIPMDVRATPLATSAIVSWSPVDRHDLVTTYEVLASTGQTASVSGNGLCIATVTGLSATTAVTFQVRAVVSSVNGNYSAPSPSVTTATPVSIATGTSMATAQSGKPAGTVYVFASGTHSAKSITPLAGDHYVLASGAILDGGGTTNYALNSNNISDITFRGDGGTCIVRNYNPPTDPQAMIGGSGYNSLRTLIDGIEATAWLLGAGVRVGPSGWVRNCNIHDSTGKVGVTSYLADGGKMENNTVTGCNSAGTYDGYTDAGGVKLTVSDDLQVRWNTVHDNHGQGIWFDVDCNRSLIERNNAYLNRGCGIIFEVSRTAMIRNNTSRDNGVGNNMIDAAIYDSDILVALSPYVEVMGNTVYGGANGIIGWQNDDHGQRGVLGGDEVVHDLYVHDNIIGASGNAAVKDSGLGTYHINATLGHTEASYYTSLNNRFAANTYTGVTRHRWSAAGTTIGKSGWQSAGQDVAGSWAAEATGTLLTDAFPTNGVPDVTKWVPTISGDGTAAVVATKLHLVAGGAGYRGTSERALVTPRADTGMLFSFQFATLDEQFAVAWLRGDGADPTQGQLCNGYSVNITPAGLVQFNRTVAISNTSLASGSYAHVNYTSKQWCRFEIVGTTLRARVWDDGAGEPGTWEITTTDTAFIAGRCGLQFVNGAASTDRAVDFDDVSIYSAA